MLKTIEESEKVFMSTRSFIGIENKDKTISYVYCHFDGYVKGVGQTLKNHYTTEDKIRELLSFGDMSVLDETLDKCEFYCDNEFITIKDEKSYYENEDNYYIEFKYLFKDNKWFVNGKEF